MLYHFYPGKTSQTVHFMTGFYTHVDPRLREATADQLEQRIDAQGVGIVLILIAARDLEDPLADQCLH